MGASGGSGKAAIGRTAAILFALAAAVVAVDGCGRVGFEAHAQQGGDDDGGWDDDDDRDDECDDDLGDDDDCFVDASVPDLDASAGCSAMTSPPGLRVYLSFDEGSGVIAADQSGHGNAGQLEGPVWAAGRVGAGVDLDGQDDTIDLGSAASVDDVIPFTVCAWVRPRSYPNQFPAIADKSSDTFTGGWNFYLEDGGTFGLLAQNRKWATGGTVELDRWQHLCASWDGSDGVGGIALYQDGAEVAVSDSGSNGTGTDSDASRDLKLGQVNNGSFELDALLDEFQLYDRVLDAAEVAGIHECGVP